MAEVDLIDERFRRVEMQSGEAVEEREPYASLHEDEVHRREDRVAHARLHLKNDRSGVIEQDAQHAAKRDACGDIGLLPRRRPRRRRTRCRTPACWRIEREAVRLRLIAASGEGRMLREPRVHLDPLDGVEATLVEPVVEHPAREGDAEIEQDPQPAAEVVLRQARLQERERRFRE